MSRVGAADHPQGSEQLFKLGFGQLGVDCLEDGCDEFVQLPVEFPLRTETEQDVHVASTPLGRLVVVSGRRYFLISALMRWDNDCSPRLSRNSSVPSQCTM